MNTAESHWIIKINKKWTRRVFWSSLAILMAYAAFAPTVCGYTDRARVAEIFVLLSSARAQVQEILESTPKGQIPAFSKLESPVKIGRFDNMNTEAGEPVFIEHYQVNSQGQMQLLASGLNIFIEFTPILENGKVIDWHCYGRPTSLMPVVCRDEKTK
jgi:hypothetical protein